MVLTINNDEAAQVLRMEDVIRVLDQAFVDQDRGLNAMRPRTFTRVPTGEGRFVANTHKGIMTGLGKEVPLEWFEQTLHS